MTPSSIPVSSIQSSPTNPRKNFDLAKLEELAASVKEHGILSPVLVRVSSTSSASYELVAGERRMRAAKIAGLDEVPAIVRELTDTQVLEIQVIENLQRDDLHPLEEAEGYLQLSKIKGYDVARIAERIGRSVKYVYDRMKLAQLCHAAREIFLEGRITAGHAILLARLSTEDQKRAIATTDSGYRGIDGGLWQHENGQLFDEGTRPLSKYDGLKAVSVRELEHWIDLNVRLDPTQVDQMVLPETAAALTEAAETSVTVLRITPETMTPAAGKTGPKLILGRSWKRADGRYKSKTCDYARLGMIEVGAGREVGEGVRGEAFDVCVEKKKCTTHWKENVQAAKRSATAVKKAVAKGEDPHVARERARKEEEARREAVEARWSKARPAILEAIVATLKKAPVGPMSPVGQLVLEAFADDYATGQIALKAKKLLPLGRSAEDAMRHMGLLLLMGAVEDRWGRERLVKNAGAIGINVKKILDAEAPEEKPAPAKRLRPAAKRATRKGK